jgi:hypothetical protein
MKLRAPSKCPVCGGEYETTKLTCKKCKSELGGNFTGCEFCSLSDEDTHFILTFLKCRGSIKDVEKELKISYPTVRGKLDGVIKRLGLSGGISPEETKKERKEIFDKLNDGEISADQAAELLKNI